MQGKEVWRLATEYSDSPAPPDELQQDITFMINQHIPQSKGSFKPWAVLTTPEITTAFRFVYPTLLCASWEKAFLWNVVTCELTQIISDIQEERDEQDLGRVNYVELSQQHVFICGTNQFRIFDRSSGSLVYHISSLALDLPKVQLPLLNSRVDRNGLAVRPLVPFMKTSDRGDDAPFVAGKAVREYIQHMLTLSIVHVSPDGRTIALARLNSDLLLVKDIMPLIKGQTNLAGASLVVSFQSHRAVYLAFEHGRVGFITVRICYGLPSLALTKT